jgi:hypothetical protein
LLINGLENEVSVRSLPEDSFSSPVDTTLFAWGVPRNAVTDGDDPATAASETFDVLAEPARVDILETLLAAYYESRDPQQFSALRRRTDFEDAGRFNYHLGKLTPEFVEKRDGGYAPTIAGMKAIQAAEVAVYTGNTLTAEGELGDDCPTTGDPLTATYDDHWLTVECEEHGTVLRTIVEGEPATDADIDEIVATAVRGILRRVDETASGHCPVCGARLPPIDFRTEDDGVLARTDCGRCYFAETNPPGLFVLSATPVAAFFHDHGIDVKERLPWLYAHEWLDTAEIVDSDPETIALTLTADGDELDVRLTEHWTVTVP